ncbi:Deoxycytidylate deaminase [Seminavis robusta]|uniref:dCMP deaminase n=1 Tax=Seminavis robusta TaxID=568900 RepID=A0A9N8F003_9STRA|nr:Deoxycytidylate deaminase [Seminavis robusta]|eukprot:Sro2507_g329720.1 Deoxycytidylate deaminase (432) ;mRNA; r:8401-9813
MTDTPRATSTTTTCTTTISTHHRQLLLEEAQYDCCAPNATTKRSGYLGWDDYFMSVAALSAQRSKDPNHPTGAAIVDADKRVIGIGYNGFPRNCSDDLLPWQDSTQFLHSPQAYECHAEVNAILNKCSADVAGASIYVKHFPCNECAKMIAQSRIREVVYIRDDHHEEDIYKASRIILLMSGVKLRQYQPTVQTVQLLIPKEEEEPSASDEEKSNTSTSSPRSVLPQDNDDNNHSQQSKQLLLQQREQLEEEHRALLQKEAHWTAAVSQKRTNYLSWDDYFMAMAFLTAQRSKDPNTQVGACIVASSDQRIVAVGYNGFPRHCSDDALPWARHSPDSVLLHTKYPYVCHAEVNAILNKGSANLQGTTLYVALFPCNECAKMIIQAGIRQVVYLQDKYHDTDGCKASRILFRMAGVKLRRHVPAVERIDIEL